MGANTLYKAVSKINATDPFEMTDKKELTTIGAPSYTSSSHK